MDSVKSAFSPESTRPVLDAACRAAGLDPAGASLIRLGENALYRLAEPVVVRIARSVDYWDNVVKEVNVARWLAGENFPAVRVTALADQPINVDEHPVTYWELIVGSVACPDDIGCLGGALRAFHALPSPSTFDLHGLDILSRIAPRVAKAPVPAEDKAMLLKRCEHLRTAIGELRFPLAPTVVHGDAHIKNLMITAGGPVLLDFEGTAWGQPEWDLAMTATEYLTAGWWTPEQYGAFVDAYGFDVTEWEGFEVLQATHQIKMTTWIMQNVEQSEEIASEYRTRIQTIRTGETGTRKWRPF